jgi:dolichol-phosphate mannosyltransferase
MATAVVVPTYQEVANIERFLREVRAAMPHAEIIVCDDNSPDGTGALAEKIGEEVGNVHVLHRPGKEGLGAAYRQGFRVALDRGNDIVIQMDVDLSHDPKLLPTMEGHVANGYDVAIGSRYVPGGSTPDWSLHRRLLSRYGNEYGRIVLSLAMRDATSGFRAYSSEILERIQFATTRANGYGFQIETGYRMSVANAKMIEVPIQFNDRTAGQSKMSVRIMAETTLMVTWWGLCLRVPGLTGKFRSTAIGKRLVTWTQPST